MAWPITAADVWAALGFAGDPDADADLYARAAVERIEKEVGPVTGSTSDSTLTGPLDLVLLDAVYATVTITVDGATLDPASYVFDADAGVIRGPLPAGTITIHATAPTSKSPTLEVATRELAAIWYRQAKGPRGGRGQATAAFQPLGFAIPREVEEKIAPFVHDKLPGIA